MNDTRTHRAKLNIFWAIGGEVVTLVCGLIVPRVLLAAFGSEAYGAVSSITQFLAYITLLEGGVGAVGRAALYKPLAAGDMLAVSRVMGEIRRFFRIIALIFIPYVLFIACVFPYISHIEVFDWTTTFILVLVISISTFAQYFIGISDYILLQSAQRAYITRRVNVFVTALNGVLVVVLVRLGFGLVVVKLGSSLVFALKPAAMRLYVRRHFALAGRVERDKRALEQKWAGLGQHIAYYIHNNTDVIVLTVMTDLRSVAVYTVYYMIISNIQILTSSFSEGMESVFGEMLAKGENDALHRSFSHYETIISCAAMIFFSATAVLIVPFVRLYTAGVSDADYIQPVFAILLLLSSVVYCLRIPYHNVVIAAGRFRETRAAAYGEAAINLTLSIVLVLRHGLVGVAIGTLAAMLFRLLYYIVYLSGHIVRRPVRLFIKRAAVNGVCFAASVLLGGAVTARLPQTSYLRWAICGVGVTGIAAAVTGIVYWIFYREDLRAIAGKLRRRAT